LIVERLGVPNGTIRDRGTLRRYFAPAVAPGSSLRFELEHVVCGVDSFAIVYRNHRAQQVVEVHWLDPAGLIVRAAVHYRSVTQGA